MFHACDGLLCGFELVKSSEGIIISLWFFWAIYINKWFLPWNWCKLASFWNHLGQTVTESLDWSLFCSYTHLVYCGCVLEDCLSFHYDCSFLLCASLLKWGSQFGEHVQALYFWQTKPLVRVNFIYIIKQFTFLTNEN